MLLPSDIVGKWSRVLKKNLSNNEGSLLDLLLKVKNSQFFIKPYDYRDDFLFLHSKNSILESNILSEIFCFTCGFEILRTVLDYSKH